MLVQRRGQRPSHLAAVLALALPAGSRGDGLVTVLTLVLPALLTLGLRACRGGGLAQHFLLWGFGLAVATARHSLLLALLPAWGASTRRGDAPSQLH